MLPAGAAERDGEVVHVRLGVERGGRDRKVHELQAGKGALDKLGDTLGGADFDQHRRLAQEERIGDRGADAQDPSRTPQAALVLYLSRVDVTVRLAELESDGVGRGHNLQVTPDQSIQLSESRRQVEMPVGRNLIPGGLEGKRTEGAGQAGNIPVNLFRVTAAVLEMIVQCGKRRTECVKEPVVGDVESGCAQFKAIGAEPHATGGSDFFIDGLGQPVEEQDQAFARADAQAGRNKVRVAGKSSLAVAENAGYGKGDCVAGELSLAQENEILAGKGDAVFSLANGIVPERSLNGAVPRAGASSQIAVEALIQTGRDGEVEDDFTVSGSEQIAQLRWLGNRVAVGEIEDEAVGQDAGCEAEYGEAVSEGLRIEGKMEKSPWIPAQIGTEEPECVFEIPALRLEVVGTEMHSFRPDDP